MGISGPKNGHVSNKNLKKKKKEKKNFGTDSLSPYMDIALYLAEIIHRPIYTKY